MHNYQFKYICRLLLCILEVLSVQDSTPEPLQKLFAKRLKALEDEIAGM